MLLVKETMANSPFSKLPAYSLPEKHSLVRSWRMCDTPEGVIIERLKAMWTLDRTRIRSDKRMYSRCTCVGGPSNLEKAILATADRHQTGEHYPDPRPNLIDDNIIDAPVRHLPTGERNEPGEEV